jgi:hypothetical protein
VLKWVLSFKVLRFIPSSDTESPIFLSNLLNKNLFQRAYRFQVLLQAAQQTGELFLAPAKKRESLGEQTVPGNVPRTDCPPISS